VEWISSSTEGRTEKMHCMYRYIEVGRLQACDAFKTEQLLLAKTETIDRSVNMVMNLWFP